MNKEWSELIKSSQLQLKKETYSEGINTLIELRNLLMNEITSWKSELSKNDFFEMPFINAKGYHNKTLAYSLWHVFRIEDIVVHTLILNHEQIFVTKDYQKKMNAPIITTGNELKKKQIEEFSKQLNLDELYLYIKEVKESTDCWLRSVNFSDLKMKFDKDAKERIQSLNVVSDDEKVNWLIDYWINKDVKGLIKMPLSRHWIMHVEACLRIKEKIQK